MQSAGRIDEHGIGRPSSGCRDAVKSDGSRVGAVALTDEVRAAIEDMFFYHSWEKAQERAGAQVREALAAAVAVIVENVPPCPDRSTAIRKLREARMDANSAITHRGRY